MLGESPEGFQVEEEKTGFEGSCVGGWVQVAGSGFLPAAKICFEPAST